MKLEQQVVSLELAKKLKKLGVKQESLYYWQSVSNNTAPEPENWYYSHRIVTSLEPVSEHFNNARLRFCSAFTVAELGEMLPYSIDCRATGDGRCYRQLSITENGIHQACYTNYTKDVGLQEADTEADARAKMLIYLIENNLITL